MTTSEATGRSATTADSTDTDAETVEWAHTAADSRLLRTLVAASLGVVVGMPLCAAVVATALAAGSLLAGEFGVALAILFALALAAVRIAPHFVAFRNDEAAESWPLHGAIRGLGRRGLAAASLFGLGVVWVGLRLGDLGFFVVAFGTIAVPMVAVSVLTSEGELDPESGTLTYCGTDVDLSALAGFRRIALGSLVVYRFSYVRGAMSPFTPRFVVVPVAVDGSLRAAVERGVAAEPGEYEPPNRAIRATLAVFGFGFFAFAAFLLTVEPTSPNPRGGAVLVYAALVTAVFGVLFLSLAARSG